MADTGLITYVLRDVDHGIADSVRFSAADEIESLERQIAELRAELTEKRRDRIADSEISGSYLCRLEAAEAENARLRALPLKDEVERVLEPLAEEADEWADDVPDGYHPGVTEPGHDQAHASAKFSLGHLRAARAILSRLRAVPTRHEDGPNRYHLKEPTVTINGKTFGEGWLLISEEEYAALYMPPEGGSRNG